MKIEIDESNLGTLCICAIRYCMGRETYMPDLVRGIVRPMLPKLDRTSLAVMVQDCKDQLRRGAWGNEYIDRPGWERWALEINEAYCKKINEDCEV